MHLYIIGESVNDYIETVFFIIIVFIRKRLQPNIKFDTDRKAIFLGTYYGHVYIDISNIFG